MILNDVCRKISEVKVINNSFYWINNIMINTVFVIDMLCILICKINSKVTEICFDVLSVLCYFFVESFKRMKFNNPLS